eukprot:31675-Alexandrium_andersonii.AAC.1
MHVQVQARTGRCAQGSSIESTQATCARTYAGVKHGDRDRDLAHARITHMRTPTCACQGMLWV